MAENFFTAIKDKFQTTDLYKYIHENTDGGDNYYTDSKKTPAILSEEDQLYVDELPKAEQLDIDRYLDIFKNDPTPVYKYLKEIKEKGTSNLLENSDFIKENVTDKYDKMRYSDYKYLNKATYDLQFRKDSEGAKEFKKAILDSTAVDIVGGAGHGLYTAVRGTSELMASLSDLYLDTNYLKIVEDVLPQVNFNDLVQNEEAVLGNFVSLLVQYGTPFGIAQKIAKKVIGKAVKTQLAAKVAKSAAATSTIGKSATNLAKYGGYWALPAGVTDTIVSATGQETIGSVFGKSKEEGGSWLRDKMLLTEPESLEGLEGKEKAAAILRNKLKFGAEGATFMGALKLVKPVAKFGATGSGVILSNVVGPVLTGASKVVANKYTAKALNVASDNIDKLTTKIGKITGLPNYEYWKFSQATRFGSGANTGKYSGTMSSIASALESVISKFTTGGKLGVQSASELRKIDHLVKSTKGAFNTFAKNLDQQMYKLSKAGFSDVLMGNETAAGALKHWADVLKYMRGEIKLTKLPDPLQESSFFIRELIDDQMLALKPFLKDVNIKEQLIKDLGKYLHQGYAMFKNSKFRASEKVYNTAELYFKKLMAQMPQFKKMSDKELVVQAKLAVADLMKIGRNEGTTAKKRLEEIVNAAEKIFPKGTLKDFFTKNKKLPDEIGDLLGIEKDPKKIILDTIVEQAHSVSSANAYKELADIGLNKIFFRNNEEYGKFIIKNGIKNARELVPVKIKKGYHLDLQDVFKNEDGSMMLTLPEIAKGMSDTNLIMDQILKLPTVKLMLAAKAATQMSKTVLSLQTQMRNITTAVMFATANGHIGSGASVVDSYKMFLDDLLGDTKDPKAFVKAIKEAFDNGALDSSIVAQQLEQVIPEMFGPAKMFGKTVSEGATSDKLLSWMFTNKGIMGRVVNKATEAYQMGDNMWKFYGYNYSKSQLLPAFKNLDEVKKYFRLVEGFEWRPNKADGTVKTLKDAIAEAAGLDVRNTYPNYSMIPHIVQEFRMIPALGNFVAFTSEVYRNSFQILTRGSKMMRSDNPYIRQIGARKLIGYGSTIFVVPSAAMMSASAVTGITEEMLQAYKDSFAADYEKDKNIMPITQQQKNHSWKATGLGDLFPFSGIIEPYNAIMQKIAEGKNTDQSDVDLFLEAIGKGFETATAPFIRKSIIYETMQEIIPDKNGVIRTKNGGKIADTKNDTDWPKKVIYHMWKKLGPTTLLSGEKIIKGLSGDLTRYGKQHDPWQLFIQNATGYSEREQNPDKNMRIKMGKYIGKFSAARNEWSRTFTDQGVLKNDLQSLQAGSSSQIVSTSFDTYQKNRYRIMSELYKDVKNLRKMNFSEKEIRDIMIGSKRISKNDFNNLKLGLFNSAEYKGTLKTKAGALGNTIRQLNDSLGTFYKVNDFINRDELQDIRKKWDNIPLGLNEEDREEYLRQHMDFKLEEKNKIIEERELTSPKAGPFDYLSTTQEEYDERMFEEKQKKKEAFQLKQETSQAPASMTLPKLDNTIMASMSTTNTGAIDPTTLLTSNETALLSPSEQAYYVNKRRA